MSIFRLLANDPHLDPELARMFAKQTGAEPTPDEQRPLFTPERIAEIRARHRDDERADEAWRRANGDDE